MRKTALYLIFLFSFFLWIISVFPGLSQEAIDQLDHIIPPSPDAAALGRAADVPVSLYTGTPSIHIPLWTMKGHTVSVPISLSYQCNGMKVSDIPGWTGQGWTLNAGGSITRSVRGNPDDMTNGYLNYGHTYLKMLRNNTEDIWKWEPPGEENIDKIEFLQRVAAGYLDLEPDIFYFNFNGHSGKFVLDPDGKPVLITPQDLKILYYKDLNGKIIRWEVTDENGVKYIFGGENASEKSTHNDNHGSLAVFFYSTWHLAHIITPNRDDEFYFTYFPHTVTYRYPVPMRKKGCDLPARGELFNYTVTTIEEKHLTGIDQKYNNVVMHVRFDADTLDGFPGGTILALKDIVVIHPVSDRYNKTFTFDYSFFPATGCGTEEDYLYPCKRLRLDKITESSGGRTKPPYRFFYDPQPLPPRGSFSVDYWGYYNGRKNYSPVPALRVINDPGENGWQPPEGENGAVNFRWFKQAVLNLDYLEKKVWELPGADLTPDTVFMQAGLLKRIVYPTGGETALEYEANRAGYIMMPEKQEKLKFLDGSGQTHSYNLDIQFGQQVTVIPLFYRKSEQGTISDNSRVAILKNNLIDPDEEQDTVFSLTYKQLREIAAGYEKEFHVWLDQGKYRIFTYAEGTEAEAGCYVWVHRSPADKIYKIYSNDYKSTQVQAGLPHFPDDSSYRVIKTFRLDKEDDPLIHIRYYFCSKLHPNVISTAGLPISNSLVRIIRLADHQVMFINEYSEHDSLDWNRTDGYFKDETYAMILDPGDYQIEFYPRIPGEAGFIRVIRNKAIATHPYVLAGGVRLKQKTDLDYARDTIGLVRYQYRAKVQNRNWSSGVLMRFPLYYTEPDRLFYLGQTVHYSCMPLTVYSNSQTELGSTSGSHIGYTEVSEIIPASGKTVTHYTSALEYPDISLPEFPFAPMMTFDWKRGQVKEKTVWSEDGKMREKTEYTYNDFHDSVYSFTVPAVKVVKKDTSIYSVEYSVYGTQTGWNHPVYKKEYQYDRKNGYPFGKTESYQYDTSYFRVREVKTFTSDSVPEMTRFTYVTDKPRLTAAVDTLLSRHMDNVKLQEESWLDSVRIKGYKTFYGLFSGNGIVAPDSVQVLEGKDYRTAAWFDQYDNRGNLLQYHKRGEVYHSFNYNEYGLVVTKADNATYRTSPDNYSPEASVTHYTQDPYYGVTSVTDPNGRTVRYEYDPFGRLDVARDPENRILKKVTYHYRQYAGDTTRPVFNESIPDYSQPPDGIVASGTVAHQGCPTILSVSGGSLGTNAVWHWYSGGCAVHPLDTGVSITVYPQGNTRYYVRAEGSANITSCAEIMLTVEAPAFYPDHDTVTLPADGTQHPVRILTNYTGCDPWTAKITGEGFYITEINESSVSVGADANPYDTIRNGTLVLTGNASDYYIPLVQNTLYADKLTLSLSSQPAFVSNGTLVEVDAVAGNGESPYTFLWERKNDGVTEWTEVKTSTVAVGEDKIRVVAGAENFSIRCTVTSGGQTVTGSVLIVVAQ